MQIEKALIYDHLRVSKVSLKFCIPTIYSFAIIFPMNSYFSWKAAFILTVSTVLSVYKQTKLKHHHKTTKCFVDDGQLSENFNNSSPIGCRHDFLQVVGGCGFRFFPNEKG